MEKLPTISELLNMFAKIFFTISVIFAVFMYLIAIVLEPAIFYFTPEGLSTSMIYLPSLSIWVLNLPLNLPIGLDLGAIFFGLWSVLVLSFVSAWIVKENFHKTIKESITTPIRKLFNSSLFALPIINSMTLIAVIAINIIQEAGGIPTGTSPIPTEPFSALFELSYSSVFEEVGFRFIPIGIFLVLYIFMTKRTDAQFSLAQKIKLFFMSFLFPDNAKKMAGKKTVSEYGLRRGISIGEWGLVLFTSIIFGLAHFNPGVSWEVGKISSAAFAGVILGLSYVVYGAHAPIIIHWFFNAYSDTFFIFSDLYPSALPLANTVTITSFILGILGWLTITALGFIKLNRAINERRNNKQKHIMLNPSTSLELDQ